MNISDWLGIGTFLVALVGVVGGLIALRQGNRQRMLDLGSLYIQRYWAIDDALLQLPKGSPAHNQARHRYLRLCEDEFEAAHLGWLDRGQWEVWHEWLTAPGTVALITEDLKLCDPGIPRFVRLRACLSACLESGKTHSWKECPAHRDRRVANHARVRQLAREASSQGIAEQRAAESDVPSLPVARPMV